MKKNLILLFIVAILISPFRVLAEGEEGEDSITTPPTVRELLRQKYKEFLLYACSESNTDDIGVSVLDDDTLTICSTITSESYDWTTAITDDYLNFPVTATKSMRIDYEIDEDNKIINFTSIAHVYNGMTEDEVDDEIGLSFYSIYTLPVVAMMNGATPEEGMAYMAKSFMSMLASSLSGGMNSGVMIVSDDATYDPEEGGDTLIIKESEFPNRVIDYVERLYGNPTASSGLYFTYGTSFERVDNDNANLIGTYSVNYDMYLGVLREYIAEEEEEEEVEQEKLVYNEKPIIDDDSSKKSVDPGIAKETGTIANPETSTLVSIFVLPVLAIIGFILYSIKFKNNMPKI